jgi:hypothetical protein
MKKLFAAFLLTAAVSQLHAAEVFYDSFNYGPAGAQVSSAGSPTWYLNSIGGTDPVIASGSLSYPGLATGSGDNSVRFTGLTGFAGISMHQFSQAYNINNVSTLYYSLTLQVTTINSADWGGSGNWNTGSFMLGFKQNVNGTFAANDAAAPLLIRTGDPGNTSGNADGFQGFHLGTGMTQTAASRVFDGNNTYTPGSTLFVVVSYTFGPNANDDVARLYVNPIPGSLESANTPVVNTTGNADVANNQISSFYLRNNSVEPEGLIIDDVRVGTAWADVTPVPEPTTAALAGLGAVLLFVGRRLRGAK